MFITSHIEAEAIVVQTFLSHGFDVLLGLGTVSVLLPGMPVGMAARVTFGDPEPTDETVGGKPIYEIALWITDLGVEGDTPEKLIFEIAKKIFV